MREIGIRKSCRRNPVLAAASQLNVEGLLTTQLENNSILESRNVTVGNKRTSMRLEPQMWDAIEQIAVREGVTINNLCTQIDKRRSDRTLPVGLTSATRIFIISYFRRLVSQYERHPEGGKTGLPKKNGHLKGSSLASWVLDKVIAIDDDDGKDAAD
jgi:predicted DNA-binding ribbon-helix-helix protein